MFQQVYICLSAHNEGFKASCKPLVKLDRCHVKGLIPRQNLIASKIDPSNQIFLMAYAIVETKSKDNWNWFIDLLMSDLGVVNSMVRHSSLTSKRYEFICYKLIRNGFMYKIMTAYFLVYYVLLNILNIVTLRTNKNAYSLLKLCFDKFVIYFY